MPLIRMLPDRYHKLVRELLAFGTAGAINTALGTLIFNLLLGMGALTATTVSTAIATISSYVMNRHVTYRHRPRTSLRRELPMFVAFNVAALFLRLGIMAVAKAAFALDTSDRLEMNVVNAVGIVAGTIFLLVTYRTVVFKPAVVVLVPMPTPAPVPVPPAVPVADAARFAALTDPLEVELSADALIDELLVTDAAKGSVPSTR